MKQLASNYSISGSSVTLTGVNVPLSQVLLVSDATSGNVLYSMAGPSASSYTQAANSVITLASAPGSSDKLTIYYDDGVAPANAPSTVAVSNFPASTEIANDVGNPIPVSGTVTISNPQTSVSVSNFPATQPVSGTVAVSNFPATQPVSGTVTATISGTPSVSAAVSNFPLSQAVTNAGTFAVQASAGDLTSGNQKSQIVNGAYTLSVDSTGAILAKTPTGSITMTNSSVGTSSTTLLAASSATKMLVVQNTHASNYLYVSTTTPATATNGILIPPTWGYEFPYIPTNALYALGSGASTTYTLWYA
jgi:hypothetical protein